MPELIDCQRDIAAALASGRAPDAAFDPAHDPAAQDPALAAALARLAGDDVALVAGRLAVYRRNVAEAGAKALRAAYPVLEQVTGPALFDILAREYQRFAPSVSGDLHDHGGALAAFLEEHEIAASLPYLGDLARLEWAVHRAYGAADAPAFDACAAIAARPASRQPSIRLDWADGIALLASRHPVLRIWRIHQADADGDYSVDWSTGETALVARAGLRVTVLALAPGEAAFVAASLAGAPLADCATRALAEDTGFDLARLLASVIACEAIRGFKDDNEEEH